MNGLELEPPAPGGPAEDPADEFALSEATAARIKAVAREYAGAFVAIETQSPEFDRMAGRISTIGADEVRGLSDQARLAMARGGSREGGGIGLDLLARLCEHLGWTLSIQSAPGRGTISRLRLSR